MKPDEKRPDLGLDIFYRERKSVIAPSPAFIEKGLGTHTAEVGFKCDMVCEYCSSAATYRTMPVFKDIGRTSFQPGFAVIDKHAPDKIIDGLKDLKATDTVILCSKTDGWSPVAREHNLGTRMLRTILEESRAKVRLITKSAHVLDDTREIIAAHRDRVTLGISVTGLPEHDYPVGLYERNASSPSERIACMRKAAKLGFRVFGMLCPLFPGLFSTERDVRRLVAEVVRWKAEDIWCEIPNPRGRSVLNCQERLLEAGEDWLAGQFDVLRQTESRSQYGVWLTKTMQKVCRKAGVLDRLHMLNYRGSFDDAGIREINKNPRGVIWL